ncbi:MAG: carboxypeptidase-like regulatory domain-containing protein, partial [Bacteroidales bacterium]|nr:carboxypeptidase-like regulatory domain-containing protein [Bacteroidales bacterium]
MKTKQQVNLRMACGLFLNRLLAIVLFVCISMIGYAQQQTISGKITDAEGNPLPGVNIVIKGTSIGTITDMNGAFSLQSEQAEAVLVVSYVGFLTEEIEASSSSPVEINLVEDVQSLDELVVVGYGVQKKSLVTGAISSVKSDDLQG